MPSPTSASSPPMPTAGRARSDCARASSHPRPCAALLHWLSSGRIDRIVLSWLDKDWHHELLRSRDTAIARVAELVEAAERTQPNDFLAHEVKAPQLPESTALGILLRYWDRLSEPEGHASLMNLLNKALGNRYVLVQKDPASAKMVFREFGGGLFNHYEAWRANGVGVPLEDLPDHIVRPLDCGCLHTALADGAPRDRRRGCHRQMAPRRENAHALQARDRADLRRAGRGRILGGSIIDNRIDLRIGLA